MTPRLMTRLTLLFPLIALLVGSGLWAFEARRAAQVRGETARIEARVRQYERALPPGVVRPPHDDD